MAFIFPSLMLPFPLTKFSLPLEHQVCENPNGQVSRWLSALREHISGGWGGPGSRRGGRAGSLVIPPHSRCPVHCPQDSDLHGQQPFSP